MEPHLLRSPASDARPFLAINARAAHRAIDASAGEHRRNEQGPRLVGHLLEGTFRIPRELAKVQLYGLRAAGSPPEELLACRRVYREVGTMGLCTCCGFEYCWLRIVIVLMM